MENFSQGFRTRYSDASHLDGIERAAEALRSYRRNDIHFLTALPEFSEAERVPRNPVNVLVFLQIAIRRGLELSDAIIRDANAFACAPVWINARSLFELGSLCFDLADKVVELLNDWSPDRFDSFDQHLSRLMLGFKSQTWHPGRETQEHLDLVPQNIVTIIQRIDKKHIPGFFSLYELLSEVAHPNYMGMMGHYHELDGLTATFIDRPAERETACLQTPLSNADGALTMLAHAIVSYDANLSPYAALCAKHLALGEA